MPTRESRRLIIFHHGRSWEEMIRMIDAALHLKQGCCSPMVRAAHSLHTPVPVYQVAS